MKQLAAALLAIFAMSTAHANVVVTNTTQNNTGFVVSNTDLLQTQLATKLASGNFSIEGSNGTVAFNNGIFGAQGNPGSGEAATGNGNSITFFLNGAYNLRSIDSYAGWDAYRGGQSYNVFYATLATPANYVLLASVFNDAIGAGIGNTNTRANIVSDSGYLASNVTSLRFEFNNNLTEGYNGYREIDVQGSAVPEPGSMALLGLGLAGLAALGRRKQG
ncbi:PEP-CTERM sorting domain-containing protein [Massilia sp. DWR3-1-1]|uniref:PEP-CTERM sorting domain-containing protein n=1 Tax=Massilia sp. DWR3-1-1 TaxID=2804559 RepID=UPI003CFA9099